MDNTDSKIEELERETEEMRKRLQQVQGTYPGQGTDAGDLIASIRAMKPAEPPPAFAPSPPPMPAPRPSATQLAPDPYGPSAAPTWGAPKRPPPPQGLLAGGIVRQDPYAQPPPAPPQMAPPQMAPPQGRMAMGGPPRAMPSPYPWRPGPFYRNPGF